MRVLIIDDQRFIRETIKAELKRQLHYLEVFFYEAECGNEAIELIRWHSQKEETQLDLIIADLKMENGDGLAVINFMAASEISNTIPLAVISSSDKRTLELVENISNTFNLYLIGVYQKPVNISLLLQQLKLLKRVRKQAADKAEHSALLSLEQISYLINQENLILCYQPKIEINTGEITGFEVLSRLCQKGDGFIYPDKFIPQITQGGLSTTFSKLVLEQAISQWMLSPRFLQYDLSVNITVEDLFDQHFIDFVINKKQLLPNTKLILELTESHETIEQDMVLRSVAKLIINDIAISLDDFGKSYSTFDRLDCIPFDEIKIDKDFVCDLDRNSQHLAIVESTIALANKLKVKAVAEGVETLSVLEHLKSLGCNMAQGYYFSPPIEGRYLESWIGEYSGEGCNVITS
ncbi:EAL domain-containing response regulator [Shewanella nanhaiensis]|uniref:EAL domain-containing response regulator n=1 Tax=Shewanella nanhaiensis TaxID=2864872 RepID=A0ABS7E9D0_9GAMM|nr:EAL domain-containing response regulator [Shewanella nanhaiensis]MBW8186299.1 EAL domain-containing response regulator [Shewanella nanhaiensis]